jgi:hypothetical protein
MNRSNTAAVPRECRSRCRTPLVKRFTATLRQADGVSASTHKARAASVTESACCWGRDLGLADLDSIVDDFSGSGNASRWSATDFITDVGSLERILEHLGEPTIGSDFVASARLPGGSAGGE